MSDERGYFVGEQRSTCAHDFITVDLITGSVSCARCQIRLAERSCPSINLEDVTKRQFHVLKEAVDHLGPEEWLKDIR